MSSRVSFDPQDRIVEMKEISEEEINKFKAIINDLPFELPAHSRPAASIIGDGAGPDFNYDEAQRRAWTRATG